MDWYIGCSGFSYKDWKGKFYPEKLAPGNWFEYYAEQFNTLEVNSTFYRFPQLNTLLNWYNKSTDHFLFAVKAPRLITHYKKFTDCKELLADFYQVVQEGLREKLGPVLFQLPPQIIYDETVLNRIIEPLDQSFGNVIEFRHESWWNKKVYNKLSKNNITFCGISHPKLPAIIVSNTNMLYYRFHGVPRLYYSEYHTGTLDQMANTTLQYKNLKKAFVYFNNTATMGALHNSNYLKRYLGIDHVK